MFSNMIIFYLAIASFLPSQAENIAAVHYSIADAGIDTTFDGRKCSF